MTESASSSALARSDCSGKKRKKRIKKKDKGALEKANDRKLARSDCSEKKNK